MDASALPADKAVRTWKKTLTKTMSVAIIPA